MVNEKILPQKKDRVTKTDKEIEKSDNCFDITLSIELEAIYFSQEVLHREATLCTNSLYHQPKIEIEGNANPE